MTEALKGIKVVDFSQGVAGPHAGMLCAQCGADVIKIEPNVGDWGRTLGKTYGDLSAYSVVVNRGKRSIAINLKTEQGRDIARKLTADCDVIIEAFRPGVMEALGFDYASVRKTNEKVVYVSVSGFGQSGERSDFPATDSIAQGYSGFINLNKDNSGAPRKIDMIVMDVITGLYAFQAIMVNLMGNFRGVSKGAHIDCSLLHSAIAFQATKIMEFWLEGGVAALYVPLGVFETADGHINISVNHNPDYAKFCKAIEREELILDPLFSTRDLRVKNSELLLAIVRAELKKRSKAEWLERFKVGDILHSPVWTYEDVLADEELKRLRLIEWLQQDGLAGALPFATVPGLPSPASFTAPHLGQHTHAILGELGFCPEQTSDLIARSIVFDKPTPKV